jgi:NitT/TauT family transport system substrate-binding protein
MRSATILRAAALAVLVTGLPGLAAAKEKITYAYQLDPMFEAAMWALKNGKIKSDSVEVELSVLPIPALIQATPTKQYDVIQSDTIAVPRSAERGLNMVIMSTAIRYRPAGQGHHIWVKSDSPAKSMADLKGKKIGVPSLGSAGFHLLRFALKEKYGVNIAVPGGDFQFVETPAPAMVAGLATDKFEAATLILSQTYRAGKEGGLRPIAQPAKDMHELWGLQMIPSVNVGYPEKIAQRPAAYKEFGRMLKASVDYMNAHRDEVFAAVAAEQKIDKEFFEILFRDYAEYPAVLSEQDRKAVAKLWQLAQQNGLMPNAPAIDGFVWADAPK